MGDTSENYWDYRECRWVACPTPVADTIPAQDRQGDPAEADDATVVSTA